MSTRESETTLSGVLEASTIEGTEETEKPKSPLVKHDDTERNCTDNSVPKKIELNAEFSSFLELRSSIDRYQKDKSVQLIVKDSKLLKAESTRKVIPKVYHLVNQKLMYHSITYCCKCHGELKQKPGSKVKNVGKKRLNCPMYIRLKLSQDLQNLVLFDIYETHNHGVDPTTFQMTPRQQVYSLSKMKRETSASNDDDEHDKETNNDVNGVSKNDKKDGTDYKPPRKSARIQAKRSSTHRQDGDNSDNNESDSDGGSLQGELQFEFDSPLDSDSSCSDSDEEEIMKNRALLPFPVRLIGSAIQSSPELLAATKQLIQIQISKLIIEKQKLILETKQLELTNTKLELEIRALEKNLANEMAGSSEGRDTTIYLQAT